MVTHFVTRAIPIGYNDGKCYKSELERNRNYTNYTKYKSRHQFLWPRGWTHMYVSIYSQEGDFKKCDQRAPDLKMSSLLDVKK